MCVVTSFFAARSRKSLLPRNPRQVRVPRIRPSVLVLFDLRTHDHLGFALRLPKKHRNLGCLKMRYQENHDKYGKTLINHQNWEVSKTYKSGSQICYSIPHLRRCFDAFSGKNQHKTAEKSQVGHQISSVRPGDATAWDHLRLAIRAAASSMATLRQENPRKNQRKILGAHSFKKKSWRLFPSLGWFAGKSCRKLGFFANRQGEFLPIFRHQIQGPAQTVGFTRL